MNVASLLELFDRHPQRAVDLLRALRLARAARSAFGAPVRSPCAAAQAIAAVVPDGERSSSL